MKRLGLTASFVCLLLAVAPAARAAPCDQGHPGHGWHYSQKCDDAQQTDSDRGRARPSAEQKRARPLSAQQDSADLTTSVTASKSFAEVGETVTWTITITNGTTEDLTDVVVVDTVPIELTVLEAATSGSIPASIDQGAISWTVADLPAGTSTALTWDGRVDSLGDLEALNSVTVAGSELITETSVFLGGSVDVEVRRSMKKPDWGTEQRTVKFNFQRAQGLEGTAPNTDAAPGQPLPFTGAAIDGWVALAGLMMLAGATLLIRKRSKRTAAMMMLVALLLTACTSNTDDPTAARPDTDVSPSDSEDHVLGKRIEREDEGDGKNTLPETEPGNDETEPQGTTDETTDEVGEESADGDVGEVVAQQPAPMPSTTVVEVPADPPAPVPLGPTPGDNGMTFEWDEASRSVLTAASSRSIRAGAPTELLTALIDPQDHLGARVELTNITESERLHVTGRLIVEVSGPDASFSLESEDIDQVLDPGDSVSADFEFLLPSGSYSMTARFRPS